MNTPGLPPFLTAADATRAATEQQAAPRLRPVSGGANTPQAAGSDRHRRRINTILAFALVALVLLAPLPVGSNRGAAWMLWAMLMGVGAAVYFGAIAMLPVVRGFRAATVQPWLWLVVAALLFALVQTLPLAPVLPGWLTTLPATGAPRPTSLSLAPGASYLAVLRGVTMLVFFVLMLEASARLGRALAIGWALFFGVAFYALWGLMSLRFFGNSFFWGEKLNYLTAATGPFINRNSFATFLGMGAVLGLALILERARVPRMRHPAGNRLTSAENLASLLFWVLWLIIILALLATESRMGFAATMLGLVLVWVALPRGSSAGRNAAVKRWLGGFAALAGFGVVLLVQGGGVVERSLLIEANSASRLDLYAQVLEMIAARPLAGYGLDAFQPAYELFHHAPVSAAVIWDKTHSTYLALWVELGVVFGTLPMLAAVGLATRLVTVLRRRRHDVALVLAALAALLVGGVHSLVDFSLEMQANQFLLLAILALGVARRTVPASPSEAAAGAAQ
ncbi:MAG: O-antigen ligase family protein [Rhodobacteraceae bacterium]|nr:O-antigen ligase family protein [Paracoccaceae bacterium]